MDAVFVLYPTFTALDIVGPFQVLSSIPDVECTFVAASPGPIVDHTRTLTMVAERSLSDADSPDLVVVPGGAALPAADDPLVPWLRDVHGSTQWTTSVCSGSLYLGAAGLLTGERATSHWAVLEMLREYGATPTSERVVFGDRIVTAAGVSSGIDMGLALVERVWGKPLAEAVQLFIEYDPQPTVDAGSPAKASPETMSQATDLLTHMLQAASS